MHDNDAFATREEAVRDAVQWAWYSLKTAREREQSLLRDLEEVRVRITETEGKRAALEEELPGEFDRYTQYQADREARFEAHLADMRPAGSP